MPWRRAWQLTPTFLPGESRGQGSLVGYSPRGRGESDTTEATAHTHANQREAMRRCREKAAARKPRKGASAEINPAAVSTPNLWNCAKVTFSAHTPALRALSPEQTVMGLKSLRPRALWPRDGSSAGQHGPLSLPPPEEHVVNTAPLKGRPVPIWQPTLPYSSSCLGF